MLISKPLKVVLRVTKAAIFGVKKVNGGQDNYSRDVSVGNGKNFEKQTQHCKG